MGEVKGTFDPISRGFRVTLDSLLGGWRWLFCKRNSLEAVELRGNVKPPCVGCRARWSMGMAVSSRGFSVGGGTKSVEMILLGIFGLTTNGRNTMSCKSTGSNDESSLLLLVKLNLLTGSRATKAGTIGEEGAVSVVWMKGMSTRESSFVGNGGPLKVSGAEEGFEVTGKVCGVETSAGIWAGEAVGFGEVRWLFEVTPGGNDGLVGGVPGALKVTGAGEDFGSLPGESFSGDPPSSSCIALAPVPLSFVLSGTGKKTHQSFPPKLYLISYFVEDLGLSRIKKNLLDVGSFKIK